MPIDPLHATRDDAFPDDGSIPAVAAGDEPLFGRRTEGRWGERRGAAAALVGALVFNVLAVVAFMVLWRGVAASPPAPEDKPITTVDNLPKDLAAPPKAPAPATPPKPAAPPAPPSPPENKAADALRAALEPPALPPSSPTPQPPPQPPTGQRVGKDDESPPPAMVEPPPEPKAAATQTAPDDKPNAAQTSDKPPEPAASPPPPTPEVLTAPKAETAVPAPSDTPRKPATETAADADETRDRTASSQLAAALPTSSLSMPSTFRAMLSAQGSSVGTQYKGAVFGSLARATQAVSEEARRRHLRGQVVLSILLDAQGGLEKVTVVQSSGSAEVDALAVDLARRAAPFPPPPPGTQRGFTPVITIGDEG